MGFKRSKTGSGESVLSMCNFDPFRSPLVHLNWEFPFRLVPFVVCGTRSKASSASLVAAKHPPDSWISPVYHGINTPSRYPRTNGMIN